VISLKGGDNDRAEQPFKSPPEHSQPAQKNLYHPKNPVKYPALPTLLVAACVLSACSSAVGTSDDRTDGRMDASAPPPPPSPSDKSRTLAAGQGFRLLKKADLNRPSSIYPFEKSSKKSFPLRNDETRKKIRRQGPTIFRLIFLRSKNIGIGIDRKENAPGDTEGKKPKPTLPAPQKTLQRRNFPGAVA
jgi:hypothetical protein